MTPYPLRREWNSPFPGATERLPESREYHEVSVSCTFASPRDAHKADDGVRRYTDCGLGEPRLGEVDRRAATPLLRRVGQARGRKARAA